MCAQMAIPLALSGSLSDLPACCRREGKHHCSMGATNGAPSSGPAAAAQTEKCPLFPGIVVPALGLKIAVLSFRAGTSAPFFTSVFSLLPADGSFIPSVIVSVAPKRGPPSNLS
jgi:hypothetical protein